MTEASHRVVLEQRAAEIIEAAKERARNQGPSPSWYQNQDSCTFVLAMMVADLEDKFEKLETKIIQRLDELAHPLLSVDSKLPGHHSTHPTKKK